MSIKKYDDNIYDYDDSELDDEELNEKYGNFRENFQKVINKSNKNKNKDCKFRKNSYDNYRK